jgi:tetratricopeptide (TPR) repeat protein
MSALPHDPPAALSRSLDDPLGIALSLDRLATAASFEGNFERSQSLYKESAAIYRDLGHQRGLAASLTNLGCLALYRGDYEQATALNEESIALYEQVQRDGMPQPLTNLGLAAFLQGRHGEALAYFREGIAVAREFGYTEGLIYLLEGMAAVLAATGDAEQAATLLGVAEAAAEETGVSLEPFEQQIHEQTVEALKRALSEEGYAVAQAGGRQLPTDEAVAWALGELESPAPVG